ncbi:MAG: hypothetical protein HYY11_07715 [Candidatus Methylomirabilis oxyfera]|nr:hypothetical protein [Candidatus Methylomirabilis oxyfera]
MFTELLEQLGLALNASGIPYMFLLSSSPYEHQALQRARVVTIGRAELRFAALEDLVIHKVIASRPRDLEDVRTVLLKNSNVDAVYIRQWLEEFERALAEPYRQRFEEIWKITR